MELNEQIEVMETVIQLKNSSLNKSQHLTSGLSRPDTLSVIHTKILLLSNKETKSLLLDYINKVIDLRQALEESRIVQLTLEERLKKEEEEVENLEQSLDQSQIDKELRLTRLHKVYILILHQTYMLQGDYMTNTYGLLRLHEMLINSLFSTLVCLPSTEYIYQVVVNFANSFSFKLPYKMAMFVHVHCTCI